MSLDVLVACEESQAVCLAFRQLGHNAFSCDLQPCSGGHPEWHFQGDVRDFIYLPWDIIIAHPPCTFLARSGSCNLIVNGRLNLDRWVHCLEAAEFFDLFFHLPCPHVAIENPVPAAIHNLPHWSQVIYPNHFGADFTKQTCLWLLGLPPLMATEIVYTDASWCAVHRSAKLRSKTFPGVALAMAQQWGDFVEERRRRST